MWVFLKEDRSFVSINAEAFMTRLLTFETIFWLPIGLNVTCARDIYLVGKGRINDWQIEGFPRAIYRISTLKGETIGARTSGEHRRLANGSMRDHLSVAFLPVHD